MGTPEHVEASTLTHAGAAALRGSTPLLRLASDERLVAITRRGNQAAYETLVARYNARLLAFCRHMVGSREDAEDVLQEVFAAAFSAMVADERPINVRPWLYRIARNRSLNHLRRQQPIGTDSMDIHVAEQGTTTADKVHKREEFRQLMADVQTLPETQRTALLLREIDALRYDQIAEAMDTTIPAVKSLLVRARVSLAEATEARTLSCDDVRLELGEVAEGIRQRVTAPARRHVRDCDRCDGFRKQLRSTNKALASVFPAVGPLLFLKKGLLAHLGTTASAGSATAATTAAVAAGSSAGSASLLSAGIGAVASKTAAGLAAAAIVTAGAVEVNRTPTTRTPTPASNSAGTYASAPTAATAEPIVLNVTPQPSGPPSTGGVQAPDNIAAALAAQRAGAAAPAVVGSPATGPQIDYDSTTLPPGSPVAGGASAPWSGPHAAAPAPSTAPPAGTGGTAAGDAPSATAPDASAPAPPAPPAEAAPADPAPAAPETPVTPPVASDAAPPADAPPVDPAAPADGTAQPDSGPTAPPDEPAAAGATPAP